MYINNNVYFLLYNTAIIPFSRKSPLERLANNTKKRSKTKKNKSVETLKKCIYLEIDNGRINLSAFCKCVYCGFVRLTFEAKFSKWFEKSNGNLLFHILFYLQ